MNNMLLELSTGTSEAFTSFDGYRCYFADGRWTLDAEPKHHRKYWFGSSLNVLGKL